MLSHPGVYHISLQILGCGNLHAGAHGGNHGAGADILTLRSGGLRLHDGLQQRVHVLGQLLGAEGHLADGAVDDVGLVQTVLDLTGFDLLDGSGHIGGHGAGLGGGHHALEAQTLTEMAANAPHVGGSDNHVELKPVLLGDLLHQIHAADIVGAGFLGFLSLGVLGEDQNAAGLTGAVGQNHGAADLLVSVTGVNAQLDVQLNGLVELGGSTHHDQIQGFGGIILNRAVDQFGALLILFTSKQCNNPP